jgi:selenide,water dikinase
VDEPWWFGQIAAANAISDVYSMGGRPIAALNLVMFPEKKLDPSVLRDILRGGADKAAEAGACIAGGHTVDDLEPKYGLSVTGLVNTDRIIKNSGALPGDALLLTKPVGSGVIFNAHRAGKLTFKDITPALEVIASLNATAIEIALGHEVHACTDITGFGIIGHAHEMASGSGVNMEIGFRALPVFEFSLDMYRIGQSTMSNKQNRLMTKDYLSIKTSLDASEKQILFDPQTSGGLLFAMPPSDAEAALKAMKGKGNMHASIIGRVTGPGDGAIEVV